MGVNQMFDTLILSFGVLMLFITLGLSAIWLAWNIRRWRSDYIYSDVQNISEQHNVQRNYISTIPWMIVATGLVGAMCVVVVTNLDFREPPPIQLSATADAELLDEVFGDGGASNLEIPADDFFEDIHGRFQDARAGLRQSDPATVWRSIYMLERVTRQDSSYQWRIVDALAAYVREAAPQGANELPELSRNVVQAALTVIGRRNPRQEDLGQLELYNSNLRGMILRGALLSGANLSRSDFRGADLGAANLAESDLSKSKFANADLQDAILTGADLRKSEGLTQAQLDLACGDRRTRVPDPLTVEPCWAAEESAEFTEDVAVENPAENSEEVAAE